MTLAIIAAVARNRVIGFHGSIPWHISEDLRRFKHLTMGQTLLMGRRTYASLGRPLPGRRTIVVSSADIPGVETVRTPEDGLAAAGDADTVFVAGGASLYAHFLPRADVLHLTLVDQEPEGDTFFPPYEHLLGTRYQLRAREDHEGFHFLEYIADHAPHA